MIYGCENPQEQEPVGYDYKGRELYGYEEGYHIDGEFVRVEDLEEFADEEFNKMESREVFE